MIILTMRTDKPEAELGVYDDRKQLAYLSWRAHRELSDTLHTKILEILNKLSKDYDELGGVVCYKGPGSFTGLRIGLSVANALAYSLEIPVASSNGDNWVEHGIKDLLAGKNESIAIPEYGSEARTTKQKK